MKNLFLIILSIILCCGCKKDKPQVTPLFAGTYHSALTVQEGPVLMYTKNKITTDINVIKSYLQRNKLTYANFYFNHEEQTIKPGFVNISAAGNNVGLIIDYNIIAQSPIIFNVDTFKSQIIQSTLTCLLTRVIKPDTVNRYFPIGDIVISPPPGLDSAYSIYEFKSPQKFIPIASSSGYTGGQYITWYVQPIAIKRNKFYFPLMTFTTYRSSEFGSEQYSNNDQYNIVNPNLTNIMGLHDTTVVQQGLVELIKQ